ncbi:MAG: hypothetical protein JRE23_00115 [Deltaproteobacteria bacterium]|nr:hypothetical protein [Deltaproteobacteria bacterium]
MNKTLDKKMAIVVIILSTGLMQIHSIPFWQEFTGDYYSGIAFSIALHGAMLWNWYTNQLPKVRVVIATLLIAGPWYQISTPVFEKIGEVKVSSVMAASYLDEMAQLEASLKKHEENSKKYKRSADRVEPTQALLNTARKNYRKEISAPEKAEASWRLYAVAVMLSAVFFVVMLTEISAVKFCRRFVSENTETGKGNVSVFSETVEMVAVAISEKMKGCASQAAFAASHNFNPRDVSNVINGKSISKKKLKEMAERLGVKVEYQRP